MNLFFSQCPNLVQTHVKEFYLLSCVHVQLKNSNDVAFSIYCDGDFRTNQYAGEDESTRAPRYSGVQYQLDSTGIDSFEGQVVGMFEYLATGATKRLYVLINRFQLVGPSHFSRPSHFSSRCIPQRLVQYHKVGQQVTTDCISIDFVQAPLFYVPALDKQMDIADIGEVSDRKQFFYVILQGKVLCQSIMHYADYLNRNNSKFCNRLRKDKKKNMNFDPFITVEDMNYLKNLLNVTRNIKPYDSDVLEDYEFHLEDYENDLMLEE